MTTKVCLYYHFYQELIDVYLYLGQLTKSQYPVFTIYVQKNCLPSAPSCNAAWSFERVMDHALDTEVGYLDLCTLLVIIKQAKMDWKLQNGL